jgi:hypothetical protein
VWGDRSDKRRHERVIDALNREPTRSRLAQIAGLRANDTIGLALALPHPGGRTGTVTFEKSSYFDRRPSLTVGIDDARRGLDAPRRPAVALPIHNIGLNVCRQASSLKTGGRAKPRRASHRA